MNLALFPALLFFCLAQTSFSQIENKLTCVAQVNKDSVVLRWVPGSVPVWQIGIKYGYVIKRYTIAKAGVPVPDGLRNGKILTSYPIRPASNEMFDNIILADYRAAVVQEAIYGAESQPLVGEPDFTDFIKAYNDLEVRIGFALFMCDLSPVIAEAAGLRFTDTDILPDERYAYSISLANIPDDMQIEPAVSVIDADNITRLPEVSEVRAVFLDRIVKFRWPVVLFKGIYTAYVLEKSTNGTNFYQISDLPLVNLSEDENPDYFVYSDSLDSNDRQMWYRVRGISPFGEYGPPSDIVSGKGTPDFSAYAVIDTSEVIENKMVTLHWRVSQSESDQVTRINILRSGSYDGVYDMLNRKPINPDVRSYTDNSPHMSNYYKIMLHGKSNQISYSFPYYVQTEDNHPPEAPVMLAGNVDSTGIVTLVWKENSEPDLLGYKVFRANDPTEEFISLVQNITSENYCHDTINTNTLTRKIFYQIVALDRNFNSSDYSAILGLSRPDTIKPAPAVITRIDVQNGLIQVQQESSPSNDISHYEIFRREETDSTSILLSSWETDLPAIYVDSPPGRGKTFCYFIRTVDVAGNHSENRRSVYLPLASKRSITLNAKQSIDGKVVTLYWQLPDGFSSVKTVIYRSKETEPISVYTTLNNPDQSFYDNNVELNTSYNYRVRVYNTEDTEVINSDQLIFRPSSDKNIEYK